MEDGDITDQEEEEEEEQEGEEGPPPKKRQESRISKCCPLRRIDELSTPNKRMFLGLWNQHAYHLPKDKVKHLKELLQQLYAMTPEETAKYFAELRAEARAAAIRKKLKQKLRKYLLEKYHQKQRERAYKLFKKLLKCGIAYAAENPVPPLVSIRLRYLSDIILEQLCDLRKVEVPNRAIPDKLGIFLISVADWMAIAVERLYYAAQLSIDEITELQNQPPPGDTTLEDPKTYGELGQPAGSSTPKKLSLDPYYSFMPPPEPVAASTPKRPQTKLQTRLPHYTYEHMQPPSVPSEYFNQSTLEMPPYSLKGTPRHRRTCHTKVSVEEKSILSKTKAVPNNAGATYRVGSIK